MLHPERTISPRNSPPQNVPLSSSPPVSTHSLFAPTRPTPSHPTGGNIATTPTSTPRARDPPHPTRNVLLRNIPPGIDDEDIRRLLLQFGPLRDLGAQHRARGGRGSVLALFYDLRHARAAVRALDSTMHFGRRLDARFQPPLEIAPTPDAPLPNHGTLVVFNLDVSTSAEDIRTLFSTVGDVKEIRATPNKKHHKFVEFYDVRDAERAMLLLNKMEVAGKRIKIEISRPGGRASSQARVSTNTPASKQSNASTPPYLSSDALGGSQVRFPLSDPHHGSTVIPSSYPPPSLAQRTPLSPAQADLHPTPMMNRSVADNSSASVPVPVPMRNGHMGVNSPTSSAVYSFDDKSMVQSPPTDGGLSPFVARMVPPARKHAPAPESYIQALYNSPTSDDGPCAVPLSPNGGNEDSPPSRRGSLGDCGARGNSEGGSPPPSSGGRQGQGRHGVATSPQSGGKSGSGQHQHNNSKFVLDIRKVGNGEETRTALMIRNIPNKYNQKMLLSTLEEGHKGHFDFIYLPIDFKNKCNVGYAFINFTKPEFIEAFYKEFHGKKWGRFNSEKVCEITFARIQGRQQLIAHFQNSSLLLEDPKCRPVIFDSKGRQEEFPIGSHVRTRRGPSNRDGAHRGCESSPPYSPPKHRGRG